MLRLRISAVARADLVLIRRFSVREFGSSVADGYLRGFDEAFDQLRVHPLAGPAHPEIAPEARSFVHRRHRILYRWSKIAS